ncbi:MAG: helix-turn-helix domain-containing protein [Treponema sp.]|jgi:transcriptional regulator with XRE-family HTH domain|nr:helix-turn-helix domain-containing protein [Treponema sp.]
MNEQELRRILSINIKRYRTRRAWSQVKLAEKLDISTNFLSDIETGKGWVSPLTLVKLAGALDIEVYELFKPETAMTDEKKDLVAKLTQDMATMLNQSLEHVRKQYLSDTLEALHRIGF